MRRMNQMGLSAFLLLAALSAAFGNDEPKVFAIAATGVSGDKQHYEKFWSLVRTFHTTMRTRYAVPDDHIKILFEDKGGEEGLVTARSTRKNLADVLKDVAEKADENDTVLILLAGHADRILKKVKWHLPGPDLDPRGLAEMVSVLEKPRVIVVVGTPLSGHFMMPLSRKGRVVITATRPIAEINETYFPYAFVEALGDLATDADEDGKVSVAELFKSSVDRVEGFFKEKELLVTEHALLDDNGDGHGSAKLTEDTLDGELARKTALKPKVEL